MSTLEISFGKWKPSAQLMGNDRLPIGTRLNFVAAWLKLPAAPVCAGSGRGRPGANENPEIGWMTAALAIDPFNTNNFLYGTGATLFGTTDANL